MLEKASWRCGGHAGPFHQEDILSQGPELGKNGVGSSTSWKVQHRTGIEIMVMEGLECLPRVV